MERIAVERGGKKEVGLGCNMGTWVGYLGTETSGRCTSEPSGVGTLEGDVTVLCIAMIYGYLRWKGFWCGLVNY